MKTHIINVQRYDTLESTLDKMVWGQSERILLVLPGRGCNFNHQFELKRLLRHSQALGAEIALVSVVSEPVRAPTWAAVASMVLMKVILPRSTTPSIGNSSTGWLASHASHN